MEELRFRGQTALVTGGARGIGLAIGMRLAREGAETLLADNDGEELDRVMSLPECPGNIVPATLNITDMDACRELVAEIADSRSRLDILVNNAAILDICPYEDLTLERFRAVTRVNLDGALACTLAAVPLMETTGGRILMTASIMGQFGSPDSLPYSSAKGGIVNMVRALACDLAPRGITVNGIAPGFIDTRMARLADGSHEHETEYFRTVYLKYRKIPLGRPGTPKDIAGAACFLVSPDAAYVTGQILAVDGGVTATF
ncbi:MAG: SDR family NAD(P)-dependent oxidoreductase [Boseongicola sp.]|nr:SDR family NAD(P)-dependent oxidoreductase [Boseongicola sp.]